MITECSKVGKEERRTAWEAAILRFLYTNPCRENKPLRRTPVIEQMAEKVVFLLDCMPIEGI